MAHCCFALSDETVLGEIATHADGKELQVTYLNFVQYSILVVIRTSWTIAKHLDSVIGP